MTRKKEYKARKKINNLGQIVSRVIIVLLFFVSVILILWKASALDTISLGKYFIRAMSSDQRETRALWINDIDSNKDLDKAITRLMEANLNVALIYVYNTGTADFDFQKIYSRTNRFHGPEFNISKDLLPLKHEDWKEPFDVLDAIIKVRDSWRNSANNPNWRNPKGGTDEYYFEVHPVFGVNSGGKQDWTTRESLVKPWMLFHDTRRPEFKKPTYKQLGIDHQFGCINQPFYQHYLKEMILGVVETYDVDGVSLDYIRSSGLCYDNKSLDYYGSSWDWKGSLVEYSNWTKGKFGLSAGRNLESDTFYGSFKSTLDTNTGRYKYVDYNAIDAVSEWQQKAVDSLVGSLSSEIKGLKPKLVISASPAVHYPRHFCHDINPTFTETDCMNKFGSFSWKYGFPSQEIASSTGKAFIQGQHAWKWLGEGLIDVSFPFLYTTNDQLVVNMIKNMRNATSEYMKYRNISNHDSISLKNYPGIRVHNVDESPFVADSPDRIGAQVKTLRSDLDVKGHALFDQRVYSNYEKFPQHVATGLKSNGTYPSPVSPVWFLGGNTNPTPTPPTATRTPTLGPTKTPVPTQTNVLRNGGFESSSTSFGPWIFYNESNATGSITTNSVKEGSRSLVVRFPTGYLSNNTQIYQKDLPIKSGTSYTVKLWAKANISTKITVAVHEHDDDFTLYGLSTKPTLGTDWQELSFTFTTPQDLDPVKEGIQDTVNDGRLRISFNPEAKTGYEYYFDNIRLY